MKQIWRTKNECQKLTFLTETSFTDKETCPQACSLKLLVSLWILPVKHTLSCDFYQSLKPWKSKSQPQPPITSSPTNPAIKPTQTPINPQPCLLSSPQFSSSCHTYPHSSSPTLQNPASMPSSQQLTITTSQLPLWCQSSQWQPLQPVPTSL